MPKAGWVFAYPAPALSPPCERTTTHLVATPLGEISQTQLDHASAWGRAKVSLVVPLGDRTLSLFSLQSAAAAAAPAPVPGTTSKGTTP
jgi:hypothetical protein